MKTSRIGVIPVFGIAGLLGSIATSQQVAAQQSPAQGAVSGLEEIVVTARKREESLQDVAISIAVVSGEALQATATANLESIATSTPNLHFSESQSGNDQLFIRGIGSGVNFGFENSVGQVLDGFFFGRSRLGRALFMDLERVEVLKGPQGALIGKNTTAGALNITTAKPTRDFAAYVLPAWEFEGDEGFSLEGAISGPLSERARGRIAFRSDDKDGFYKNLRKQRSEMQREELYLRGIIELDISETLQAQVLYQRGEQERVGRNRELSCTPAFTALVAPFGEDCKFNYTNATIRLENGVEIPEASNTVSNVAGLTLNLETKFGTVTSLTGVADYRTTDNWDSDSLPIESTTLGANETWKQKSQEFRLTSLAQGNLGYIVGAYYLETEQITRFRLDFNASGPVPIFQVLPPAFRARNNRFTDTDGRTVAGFAELTYQISPEWRVIGGLRYTDEEKSARNREFATVVYTDTPRAQPAGGPAANAHDVFGDRRTRQWTPNGVIQFKPSDVSMFYASVSRGFKGGGFDNQLTGNQATAQASFEFDDEQVTAYEVGGKFRFPAQQLQVNTALFRSNVKNVQVSSSVNEGGAVLFKVGNAASAVTQGLEVDFRWAPIEGLRIGGAAAYLDAKFGDYRNAACFGNQTAAQGCVNGLQDLGGRELQFSPDWKFSLDATYSTSISDRLQLSVFARNSYTGRHALALSLDPNLYQDGFSKWDASIAISSSDDRWRISIIGQNLTDKMTANFGNTGAGSAGASYFFFGMPPRSITIQGRWSL